MTLDDAFAELKLVQDFIPAGRSNRPGTHLSARFITIHNTDNATPGANAAAHTRYQKGQDARDRQVSWHFTVDDKSVFQSLPTSEVGWHTGTASGNRSSIGIEICMHPEMDQAVAYRKAALLTAVMARRLDIEVPAHVVQHHHWSGKNCPRILRQSPDRWDTFIESVVTFASDLQDVAAPDIDGPHDHGGAGAVPGLESLTERFTVLAKPSLRLRAGPGTDFDIVSSLPFGTRVTVISRFADWSMIDLDGDGGGDGFVHSAFLKRV